MSLDTENPPEKKSAIGNLLDNWKLWEQQGKEAQAAYNAINWDWEVNFS